LLHTVTNLIGDIEYIRLKYLNKNISGIV